MERIDRWTKDLLHYAEENVIHEWEAGGYIVKVLLSCQAADNRGWTVVPPYSEHKSLLWFKTIEQAKSALLELLPFEVPIVGQVTLANVAARLEILSENEKLKAENKRLSKLVTDLQYEVRLITVRGEVR